MLKKSIAVLARDPDRRDSLTLNLRYENFDVQAPHPDEQGVLEALRAVDLIIVDIAYLRENMEILKPVAAPGGTSGSPPMLLVLERNQLGEEKELFKDGVEDYLVMPFSPLELTARVRNLIQRELKFPLLHPVSRLPGTSALDLEIGERLVKDNQFAVVFSELQNFKGFNYYYGYDRGDILIGATADVFKRLVEEHTTPLNFLAHGGGGDFTFVTTPEMAGNICEKIVDVFDDMICDLYDPEDRDRGFIGTHDRKGKEVEHPMVTISLAIVSNSWRPLTHPVQIRDIGKELLRYAKGFSQSCCVIDRRRV